MDDTIELTELQCTKCKQTRPIDQFNRDSSRKTGYRAWCKVCQHEWKTGYYEANQDNLRAYTKQWALDNPERKRDADTRYREENRDAINAYFRERYQEFRQELLDQQWVYHLRRAYKLTPERYLEILISQDYGCAICGKPPTQQGRGKHLHVDHDHDCCDETPTCGKCVRGLLCFQCNVGLGKFGDEGMLLVAAAYYLESHK